MGPKLKNSSEDNILKSINANKGLFMKEGWPLQNNLEVMTDSTMTANRILYSQMLEARVYKRFRSNNNLLGAGSSSISGAIWGTPGGDQ